ncbi:right-handed parallel beta-helix repeat-containing protein [Microvirga solisilvae]|uniref:right-handed parallel beta-helix repeat-containing protein n=1 Tax=Microvirga solisilvae TaxID=2919498 RepID=UPI001FAECADE|nr:right-handed parallel beta-helix repeat-containing protein [Microvirga solisilvae]
MKRKCTSQIAAKLFLATLFTSFLANNALSETYFVNPDESIQKAIDRAMPGDTIRLAPGRYFQDFKSVRNGEPRNPIVIRGDRNAIVSGAGANRIIEINHDYIELHGFTIDGRHAREEGKHSYRNKLVYAVGNRPGDGVTGLRLIRMTLKNAGGECVRLRYQARRNEIAYSSIENCGIYDFVYKKGGKNGEGIYIGTAPEQLGLRGVPDSAADRSDENWIHHNSFNTRGNECVDIKEGSSGNVVEHNRCTGQRDSKSAGLDARGSGNTFRHNVVYGNRGAGIRLGGDEDDDGIGNSAYSNTLRDNVVGSLKIQRGPQGKICGNVLSGKSTGVKGEFGDKVDPRRPC